MEEDAVRSFSTALTRHVRYRREEHDTLGPWDELEQLEALYADGAISNEELAEGKRTYLDEIRKESERRPTAPRLPN